MQSDKIIIKKLFIPDRLKEEVLRNDPQHKMEVEIILSVGKASRDYKGSNTERLMLS